MAKKSTVTDSTSPKTTTLDKSELAEAIGAAVTAAIEVARPTRKTAFNRKKNTPWSPKNGEAKMKLKRKLYQHGIPVRDERMTNEQIQLANKIRPGTYCDGFVKVIRRRDKGIDIDYPIRTASQRMRLVTDFGIRDFTELLQACLVESSKPTQIWDEDGDAI